LKRKRINEKKEKDNDEWYSAGFGCHCITVFVSRVGPLSPVVGPTNGYPFFPGSRSPLSCDTRGLL